MSEPKILDPGEYKFEMGLYLSEGWNIFKKGAGSFVGFTILYFVISGVVAFLPLINFLGGFIQYALAAGVYIFCRNLLNDKEDFSQFFKGFNYFAPIFFFFLILSFFVMPFSYLILNHVFPPGLIQDYMAGNVRPNEFYDQIIITFQSNTRYIFIMITIFTLIAIYLYVSYSLTLPLIADSKLSFWDAMESSRRTVSAKFFEFLAMYVVLGIFIFVGSIITCGVGLVIFIPYSFCVVFAAYNSIFKLNEDDSIQDAEFTEIE
jgi:hypothetical protein